MKKLSPFLIWIMLFLFACSPQVTVTSTATIPPPTETPIPAPTLDPQFIALQAAQEFFGDAFEVTSDGKVIDKATALEIPGFTIVKFDEKTMINRGRPTDTKPTWAVQRVYEFEDRTDFTVNMTQYDIKVEDGKIDMFGWIYDSEIGEFTRQKVEFAAPNNGVVKIDGYSPEEVQYLIMTNSSANPNFRINSFQARRQLAFNIPQKVADGVVHVTYKGMWEPIDFNFQWFGNNFVPTINMDGTYSTFDTTEFMVFPEFKDRSKALVVWMGADNKPVIVVLEGKYLDLPKYFNKYWETHDIESPFNP